MGRSQDPDMAIRLDQSVGHPGTALVLYWAYPLGDLGLLQGPYKGPGIYRDPEGPSGRASLGAILSILWIATVLQP